MRCAWIHGAIIWMRTITFIYVLPQTEAITEEVFVSRLLERSRNDSDFFLAHQTVSLELPYYPGTPEVAIYGIFLWRLGKYEEGIPYLTLARQKYRDWLVGREQETVSANDKM